MKKIKKMMKSEKICKSNFLAIISNIYEAKIVKFIIITNNMPNLMLTDILIPIVINAKNITNSNGFLTGFLKRTIDNAPTIPRDRAIFPVITFVIIKVITGSNMYDIV